jgi:hypothetical protein
METPFIVGYISRSILRGGQIPKVPAGGTIWLVKRSTKPVITGFPRVPSFTTGISQIPNSPANRRHMRQMRWSTKILPGIGR